MMQRKTLSVRRNQEKEKEDMISNEVGKIEVAKLNNQHEPSSRDAVKVLENIKPRSSTNATNTSCSQQLYKRPQSSARLHEN